MSTTFGAYKEDAQDFWLCLPLFKAFGCLWKNVVHDSVFPLVWQQPGTRHWLWRRVPVRNVGKHVGWLIVSTRQIRQHISLVLEVARHLSAHGLPAFGEPLAHV